MAVKARWHTPELSVSTDDVDALFAPAERIEDVGVPIDLSAGGEQARLNRRLIGTLAREAALEEQGVSCQIKQASETSCFACALFCGDDTPEGQLCQLGREQERLCTQIVVMHRGGRRQ